MTKTLSRHRRGLALLAMVSIALGGFLLYRQVLAAQGAQPMRYVTQPVQRETLLSSVSGTGNMAVGRTYEVDPPVAGTVEQLDVSVGDRVKKGQVLFVLGTDGVDQQIESSLAAYNQARISTQNARVSRLQAQQQLEQAQEQLANQSTTTTVRPTTTTVRLTTTTVRPTTTTAGPTTTAASSTTTTVPAQSAAFEVVRASYTVAQAGGTQDALDGSDTATGSDNVTQYDVDVARARLRAAELSLEISQEEEGAALEAYEEAQADLDKREVLAPSDEVITEVNVSVGESVSSGGSTSSSSTQTGGANNSANPTGTAGTNSTSSSAAIVMTDMDSLQAVVSLNEVDVFRVKRDAKATLTLDAIEDLTLTGRVVGVDTVGTNSSGVVTYGVTIAPDTMDERILPGMTVSATIITEVRQNVLAVPSGAVKSQSGAGQYVQVLVNGAPEQRAVETGLVSDSSTEIISGLSLGEEVITQTIDPSVTSTTGASGGLGVPGLGGGAFGGGPAGGGPIERAPAGGGPIEFRPGG